ncbi:serine hydrolase [Micromonospora zhanjiangensis]|uniref:Beta-lactamase enzyme family protein n=1 Tax=Micromonospora zhanjiangensis TaxID=1522057 RepID=A0ABV8KS61_9ACTN
MTGPYRPASRRRRHRRASLPRRLALIAGLVVVVLAGLRLVPGSPFAADAVASWGRTILPGASQNGTGGVGSGGGRPSPTQTPSPLPPLPIRPAAVKVDIPDGWVSWAMMDRRTGKISGSANMTETSTTASMIKSWIVADFLRRNAEQGTTPSDARMRQVSITIRDSDNDAAEALWRLVGREKSIDRLIDICKLTDSSAVKGFWSNTHLSPRDITRLGACIADGRAAGPKWTKYLLGEMEAVRGVGNFGIRLAFPEDEQDDIAIKNGWVTREDEGNWHVSCLAIGDGWSVGVMTRYPIKLGFEYGTKVCLNVGKQLLAT